MFPTGSGPDRLSTGRDQPEKVSFFSQSFPNVVFSWKLLKIYLTSLNMSHTVQSLKVPRGKDCRVEQKVPDHRGFEIITLAAEKMYQIFTIYEDEPLTGFLKNHRAKIL